MSADILHEGHLNLLSEASKYGQVMVGVLTDLAISKYKRIPFMSFEERVKLVSSLKLVDIVVEQDSLSYRENLLKYKPDFVVHGDDWKSGVQSKTRQEVIDVLQQIGGSLVEPNYTKGVSSTKYIEALEKASSLPEIRLPRLKRLLDVKNMIRVIEVHNGISALIVETLKIQNEENSIKEFDGFWLSSLTDSTVRGKPDIEVVDVSQRLATISEIAQITTKPMIYDADTGGQPEHLHYTVQSLERNGISAAIIEDKTGLKRNSLLGNDVLQTQSGIQEFCEKISSGVNSKLSSDFMLIARIESLILDKPVSDALTRADAYLDAGADGIMIHSRNKSGEDIKNFLIEFRKHHVDTPLVVVPTSFNHISASELADMGVNIVIYANQLLRAAYPAMLNAAQNILKFDKSMNIEKDLMSIPDILKLIPGENLDK